MHLFPDIYRFPMITYSFGSSYSSVCNYSKLCPLFTFVTVHIRKSCNQPQNQNEKTTSWHCFLGLCVSSPPQVYPIGIWLTAPKEKGSLHLQLLASTFPSSTSHPGKYARMQTHTHTVNPTQGMHTLEVSNCTGHNSRPLAKKGKEVTR